jgi:hypothetical protein
VDLDTASDQKPGKPEPVTAGLMSYDNSGDRVTRSTTADLQSVDESGQLLSTCPQGVPRMAIGPG